MANFLECRKAEVQHPRNPLLEAAPIGWQLFVLESGKSASIAFLLLLATDATRLLAQALSPRHRASSGGIMGAGKDQRRNAMSRKRRTREEEVVEEDHKRLEELMRLYGLEEKEARAAYYLGIAEELFEEISEEAYRRGGFARVRGVEAWMHDEMDFGEHFHALRNQLARRVLQRDYPEGWGMRPGPSSDARLD